MSPVELLSRPSPEVTHHWFQLLILTAICDGTTNRDEVTLIDTIARDTGMEVTWTMEELEGAIDIAKARVGAVGIANVAESSLNYLKRTATPTLLKEIRSSMFRLTLVDGELAPREQELWDMMDRIWKI